MAFQFAPPFPPVKSRSTLFADLTALGLTTNLKLCLDAGDSSSYTSGQKWLDRSGGGYDFFLGANGSVTATDPTFNGAAGGQSDNEYWSFDGGDYFTYDTTNEAWMETLHKDGAIFSIMAWVYPVFDTIINNGVIGTAAKNDGPTTGVEVYVKATSGSTSEARLEVLNAGSVALGVNTSSGAIPDQRWSFVSIVVDEASGVFRSNVNGIASSASGTYSSPASGSATNTMQIGSLGNATATMRDGSRVTNIAVWQGVALSAANLTSIFQRTRSRFGV